MFDRERINANGLSAFELTIVGVCAATIWLVSDSLYALLTNKSVWSRLADWSTARTVIGMCVGVPLLGSVAYRALGLGLLGQLIGVAFAVAGGGPLLILVVEQLIRVVIRM